MADCAVRGHVILPVAIETSSHLQRLTGLLLYHSFSAHVAVTDGAGLSDVERLGYLFTVDADFVRNGLIGEIPDMRFVDESDVVGKAVDPLPVDGLVRLEGCSNLVDLGLGGNGRPADVLVAEQA